MAVALLTCSAGCQSLGARDTHRERSDTRIDYAIVTVIPAEYHAMRRRLQNARAVIEPDGLPNAYQWTLGEMPGERGEPARRVVLALAGEAGEVSGALATQATLERWHPRDLLVVGIAGGIHESVDLGDVVVSSQIWAYEHGHLGRRFDSGNFFLFQADPVLLEAALAVDDRWTESISVSPPTANIVPRVVVGKTASGNKVVENASSIYYEQTLRLDQTIVSVDMEGAGAAAAIARDHDQGGTTGFLMIRGVSDVVELTAGESQAPPVRGRNPQRGEWKEYAAEVAACFAARLIETREIE